MTVETGLAKDVPRELRTSPFDEVVRVLLVPLVLAGLGELVLNRTISRATIFVPKGPVAEAALSAMAYVGLYLLALAFILAVAWVSSLAARRLLQDRGPLVRKVFPSILLFFAILSITAVLGPGLPVSLTFAALFLVIITVLLTKLWRDGWAWKGFVLAIWASYTLYVVWVAFTQIESLRIGLDLEVASMIPRAGEVVALLATPFLFLVESRSKAGRLELGTRGALLAAIPAALFAFLVTLNRPILANISIWSTGFSLFLPFPVYAAAIWLYAAAVLAARRHGRRKEFLAYLLILIAGYNLSLTYPYVVAVIALILFLPESGLIIRTGRSDIPPERLAPDSAP